MKKQISILFLILSIFSLCSCQANKTFTLIEPGRIEINNMYSVETNKKWSQFNQREFNFVFWTVNGYSLERIVFFKPISDSESLYDHNSLFTKENEKRPVFTSDMNKFEIKEYFLDCILWSRRLVTIESENFKAYKMNNIDGISFDIKGRNELGLNYKGFVIAGVKEKKLLLAYFIAAELEMFNKYKSEAKKILNSIKFL
tara:strand:- start:452 stop:1051 length:600 start_codon:yes stop_codon:yes gene_type:complete